MRLKNTFESVSSKDSFKASNVFLDAPVCVMLTSVETLPMSRSRKMSVNELETDRLATGKTRRLDILSRQRAVRREVDD